MDARGAGVMDLAMGNGHLPAADVRNLARGKDARAPLTEVLYCALIADVI